MHAPKEHPLPLGGKVPVAIIDLGHQRWRQVAGEDVGRWLEGGRLSLGLFPSS